MVNYLGTKEEGGTMIEFAAEMTNEDMLQLFMVGTGVSFATALTVENVIRPFAPDRDEKPLQRKLLLLLSPLPINVLFTVPLFPVAVQYLTRVDPTLVSVWVCVILGLMGGVGSTWAYDIWDGIGPLLFERWAKGKGA